MLFKEFSLPKETVDKILNIVQKYNGQDVSMYTSTQNGYQTDNIINLFDREILKEIEPDREIFHIHYIKYNKGGFQLAHNHHKTENYSFIIYLNNSDGPTYLMDPINKKIYPETGKTIVFDARILHYGEKCKNQEKKILVGAIK